MLFIKWAEIRAGPVWEPQENNRCAANRGGKCGSWVGVPLCLHVCRLGWVIRPCWPVPPVLRVGGADGETDHSLTGLKDELLELCRILLFLKKKKKKKQTSNWYILLSTHSTFADLMYFGSNKCVCWNLWFFFLLNCHWISSLCIVFLSLFHVSLHNFLMEKGGVTTRGSSWSKGRWSWNPYAWANNRATFCFVNHFLWGQLLLLHPVE